MKKILVIAAHYDDEVLGVGGTLLKHKEAGDEIYICIIAKGFPPEWTEEHNKKQLEQAEQVDQILGTKKRFHCELPAVRLNTIPSGEFNKKISQIVNEVRPDVVYTHFEHDINIDHKLAFQAANVATRPTQSKKIKFICFETPSSTEWGTIAFKPNFYVNISDHIDKKITAFLVYESEVKKYPHPRNPNAIKNLAKIRGSEAIMNYAEALKIIRNYE
jgi:N-acetylglucosamine malate deacetylase 1